eukprot:658954_1
MSEMACCQWCELGTPPNTDKYGVLYEVITIGNNKCIALYVDLEEGDRDVVFDSGPIYLYNLDEKIWTQHKQYLPTYGFSCVLSFDEQNIITFGGIDGSNSTVNHIYVADVDLLAFKRCPINVPSVSGDSKIIAVKMNSSSKCELVTCGFIRRHSDGLFASDLMECIAGFCHFYEVHLISSDFHKKCAIETFTSYNGQ